jgi:hypothetical protein
MIRKPETKISLLDKIQLFLFPLFSIPDKPEVRAYLDEIVAIKQEELDKRIMSISIKKEL